MDIKTEIVALAVRILKDKTDLVATPDTFTEVFAVFATGKTHDVRTAEAIIESAATVANFAKKTNIIRKFKKSIPNHL